MQFLYVLRLFFLFLEGLLGRIKKIEEVQFENDKHTLKEEINAQIDEAFKGENTAKDVTDVMRGNPK